MPRLPLASIYYKRIALSRVISHGCAGGGSWNGGRGSSRAAAAAAADRRGREEAARPLTLREKAIQKRTATGQRDSTANTARVRRA